MIRVATVSVDYNSHHETHAFLSSIKKMEKDGVSLLQIVVDNSSTEPLVLTSEESRDGVIMIRSHENVGFTGGSNIGISYALSHECDYVLLINNDTTVDKHLLEELLATTKKYNDSGIVSPKIFFAKGHEFHKDRYAKEELGHVLWYAGGFVDWGNVFNVHRGVDEVDHGQYDHEEQLTFATGCCMLIPTKILKKIGLFDEKYFLYFEDGDFSQRVLRHGFAIWYCPKAYLWHVTSASAGGSGSFLHDYFLTRNRMLFGMRYAPIRSRIALLRESVKLFMRGRKWQKIGIKDFFLGKFGRGSFSI